jgi:hypothetical protein
MGSDTSPHVLRFTGFDHRREHRRLGVSLPHQRCGDGEVSGSGVSEGVCEALTFMEWSTMVVPTYTLKVAATPCRCASTTIRLCESATLCRVVRDSKNTLLATAPADSAETFTVRQRACALSYTV